MLTQRIRTKPSPWLLHSQRRIAWHIRRRSQSITTAPKQSSPASQSSTVSPVPALIADLDRLAPRIDINAAQIEILHEPSEFYRTLKAKILDSRQRIYISTLYIGKTEHELLSTIREALLRNGPNLKVSILTDALRGTRETPEPSCASLLASLVAEFPNQVEVRMYHTPNLTGIRKTLIPKRINEGWGLQHIKLYGFDDEVILSGANLSNDYFMDRQDRYHVFRSKRVTDYFATIHQAVCSISYLLKPQDTTPSYELDWPTSNRAPDPLKAPKQHIETAHQVLAPLVNPQSSLTSQKTDTSVYPLFCHPHTINTELPAFKALLSQPLKSYTFTAGYFNPHPQITSYLLALSSPPTSTTGTVLTASPYANGFFGSKGISGMLPAAYSYLSLRFLQAARGKDVQLREWQRGMVGQDGGWTYHAKGLWATFPNGSGEVPSGPSATLLGSSNYTTRSYGLDLEVGALVVTNNGELMRKWKREEEMLLEPSRRVEEGELASEERRADLKTRVAMWIVRLVGGSL